MIDKSYPYYLGNEAVYANEDLAVVDKYSGEEVARVAQADEAALVKAIDLAEEAAEAMRQMRPYERKAVLEQCVEAFEARREELAYALCVEAGKPLQHSQGEVSRLIDTFRVAAEESVRQVGEVMPLEISARARGYSGMWKRQPLGPCGFITPFNFPLNLVAHKVAPALAVGCPFVLKPALNTPLGALILGEVLAETELPRGAFSIVTCSNEDAGPLVEDDRLKLLSFTGSGAVGWMLKAKARKKRVSLELGGNAACIVDEGVDLDDAAARIVVGAYYQSGQSCVSVQRILAHRSVYEGLKARLVERIKALKMGDPKDPETFVGPVISAGAAERIEAWVEEAVSMGATVLVGGKRDGVMIEATLLEGVAREAKAYREEIFGPVALMAPFDDFDAALDEVNDSPYGLQAGVFTRDIYRAHRAWDRLDVGGVIVGDVPSWRVDHMPYGGVKDSGLGREGLRFAMDEMSEIKLMVLRDPSA